MRIKLESIVEAVKGVGRHMKMNVKVRKDLRTFDSMKVRIRVGVDKEDWKVFPYCSAQRV